MTDAYDYNKMVYEAEEICGKYPFAQLFCIGESVMGRAIYCIKIGTGERKLFLNGAHHGLEYLTSAMLMEFAGKYCEAAECATTLFDYEAASLLERTTLYIVPMVNPDGVDLAVHGADMENRHHMELIRRVGMLPFDKVWQANIRGVDINHNYDADWQTVSPAPAPTRYSGPYPESEEETRALVKLTRSVGFDMVIAFHSQGGEIYYDFNGLTAPSSYYFAEKFAEVSGYTATVPGGSAAFGGYKDWFIKEFGRAGFTVEIGRGKNPLGMNLLDSVYAENAPIILCALAEC